MMVAYSKSFIDNIFFWILKGKVLKMRMCWSTDLGVKLKESVFQFNGWQLAKMKKSIPDMSLPWNL